MGLFRKDSSTSQHSNGSGGGKPRLEFTKEDKLRTGTVHDPILQAVNEAQPFEEAALDQKSSNSLTRQSYLLQNNGGFYDVFGKPINQPDVSNPTRSRDERPLDTIRGFEYSITGDNSYRERLESDSLGFRVRDDFPSFSSGNPYAMANTGAAGGASNYGGGINTNNGFGNGGGGAAAPLHSFSGDQQAFEQGVYEAPAKKVETKKKKGLFGRKKNN